MKLTREMIATIAKQYKREQDYYYAGMKIDNLTGLLADALLAEMDKPGVWDKAPEDATFASVYYCPEAGRPYKLAEKHYFFYRELHKSRERQIAEEYAKMAVIHGELSNSYITEYIEKAILKYKAELEAGK